MTFRPAALCDLLVVLTLACTATAPQHAAHPVGKPPTKQAPAAPTPPTAVSIREDVDPLLEKARAAVADGDEEEYRDCEVAVAEVMAQHRDLYGMSPEFTAYVSEVFAELTSLDQDLADGDENATALPSELAPVPQERVAEMQERASQLRFDLPVVVNQEVASLVDYYIGRGREWFIRASERGARYLPTIREELQRAGLPLDLAYLPMVESGFNARARSRARAQGLWQFVAGTGRLYDLHSDGLVDERNDPEKATRAAVRHLADLHGMFGDWELALAAYNSGAGRVLHAQKRAKGAKDFWSIRRALPKETRNYVPGLWAALVVAKNPTLYGLPVFEDCVPCSGRIPIDGALDLQVLAERAQLDIAVLADLNPALAHSITPRGSYQLAVPCGEEQRLSAIVAGIPESERIKRFLHVVRKGDTPSSIARLYGSSVDAIMAANGLKSPRSLRIGQTLTVPRTPTRQGERTHTATKPPTKAPAVSAQAAPTATPARQKGKRYVVRQGDTLSSIARRFGTSATELQRLNSISDSRINPGDVLQLAP
jgi:membrane-bound lytic murein transglycosylase D